MGDGREEGEGEDGVREARPGVNRHSRAFCNRDRRRGARAQELCALGQETSGARACQAAGGHGAFLSGRAERRRYPQRENKARGRWTMQRMSPPTQTSHPVDNGDKGHFAETESS